MIWQPEFTDKTLSRKPGAVQIETVMIIILGVLLLLSLFFNIWFWDHYMRVIPLSADKSSMFAIASSCENPRWVQEVESRGGMTRKEWADFVDRNFNPPK